MAGDDRVKKGAGFDLTECGFVASEGLRGNEFAEPLPVRVDRPPHAAGLLEAQVEGGDRGEPGQEVRDRCRIDARAQTLEVEARSRRRIPADERDVTELVQRRCDLALNVRDAGEL